MQKDFDKWNEKKKVIDSVNRNRPYFVQEIWWCSLGMNVGFEHDGVGISFRRPVLVLKGLSANTCLAVPLTASPSTHPLRIPIGEVGGKQASAILSQMRVIDTKRLLGKIGILDTDRFETTRKAVKDML